MWGGIILPTLDPYSLFTQQSVCKLFRASQVLFNQLPPHCSRGAVVSASMCFQPSVNPTGFSKQQRGLTVLGSDPRAEVPNIWLEPLTPQEESPHPCYLPLLCLLVRACVLTQSLFLPFFLTPCGSFFTTLVVEEPFCLSPSCFQRELFHIFMYFDVFMGQGEQTHTCKCSFHSCNQHVHETYAFKIKLSPVSVVLCK